MMNAFDFFWGSHAPTDVVAQPAPAPKPKQVTVVRPKAAVVVRRAPAEMNFMRKLTAESTSGVARR